MFTEHYVYNSRVKVACTGVHYQEIEAEGEAQRETEMGNELTCGISRISKPQQSWQTAGL